jgi:hypothetical protein
MLVKPHILTFLATTPLMIVGCRSPRDVIRPVIHDREDRIAAMKSAPIIIVAEIHRARLLPGKPLEVEKPPGIGGIEAPRIPLDLAEISATVRLILRGSEMNDFEFYTWVYHFGKHGGLRLFDPQLGSFHIMFLKKESGYFHTVGDYPNYDLEVPSKSFPSFLSIWQTGYGQESGLMERIVAVRLKAHLESGSPPFPPFRIYELTDLTSPAFVAHQLDSLCRGLENQPGRATTCTNLMQEVPLTH